MCIRDSQQSAAVFVFRTQQCLCIQRHRANPVSLMAPTNTRELLWETTESRTSQRTVSKFASTRETTVCLNVSVSLDTHDTHVRYCSTRVIQPIQNCRNKDTGFTGNKTVANTPTYTASLKSNSLSERIQETNQHESRNGDAHNLHSKDEINSNTVFSRV